MHCSHKGSVRAACRLFGVFLLAAASAACDEKLSDIAGPSPNLQPTFSSIQQNIFQTTDLAGRTACVNCHNPVGASFAGRMNLQTDAYNALVNVPAAFKPGAIRVIPGDPENSYLIHKLEGRSGIVGVRMPQNGPPYLTEGQIQIIKRWIELGARND